MEQQGIENKLPIKPRWISESKIHVHHAVDTDFKKPDPKRNNRNGISAAL